MVALKGHFVGQMDGEFTEVDIAPPPPPPPPPDPEPEPEPEPPPPPVPVDPSSPRINVMKFGAVGDAKHDDSENILDAIDSAPKRGGAVIYFPQPPVAYLVEHQVKITGRALTLLGSGKLGENEGQLHAGSVILCETPGRAAFDFDRGRLQHQGSVVRELGLHTSDKTVTLLRFWEQNRWRVEHCGFRGGAVGISAERGEDNAWNVVEDNSFRGCEVGVFDQGYGTVYRGGKWLVKGWAIWLDHKCQHAKIRDIMVDRSGGVKMLGGNCLVEGGKFEDCNPGILVDGDKNRSNQSGFNNYIGWNHYSGGGSTGRGLDLVPGARNTLIMPQSYTNIGSALSDNGTNTRVIGA